MHRTAYPRLENMFGAFFHQDWVMEGRDWPDLVRNYAMGQPQSELSTTADELDQFLSDFPDESELDRVLFSDLMCSYDPRPRLGGSPVRIWLRDIAAFLRAGAGLV